jgi:Galactose oxidase, central domain
MGISNSNAENNNYNYNQYYLDVSDPRHCITPQSHHTSSSFVLRVQRIKCMYQCIPSQISLPSPEKLPVTFLQNLSYASSPAAPCYFFHFHFCFTGCVYHRSRRQGLPLCEPSFRSSLNPLQTSLAPQGGRLVTERRMVTDLYVFDLKTLTWEKIPAPADDCTPAQRYFHSADACECRVPRAYQLP